MNIDSLAQKYDPDEIQDDGNYIILTFVSCSKRNKAYLKMMEEGFTLLDKDMVGQYKDGSRRFLIKFRSPNWEGPERFITIDELREQDGMPGVQRMDSLQKNLYT